MNLVEKWKEIVSKANEKGIPLPTIRDPKTGCGSVSLTMVFVSFNIVIAGVIGKWSGYFGGIDVSQALQLFYASAALYFGRRVQKNGNEVVVEKEEKQ